MERGNMEGKIQAKFNIGQEVKVIKGSGLGYEGGRIMTVKNVTPFNNGYRHTFKYLLEFKYSFGDTMGSTSIEERFLEAI
jgi:hypothetical protein